MNQKDLNAKEGMRIKLTNMVDDPNPIPVGTKGTISLVDHSGIIHVDWDNGRRLGVIPGVDEYILEPDFEEALEKMFDDIYEDSGSAAIKNSVKKTPSVVNKSMPKPTKMSSSVKSSLKSSGIKTGQVTKNFKSANIKDVKVESEKEITEITGAGGAGGPTASGPYVGPMGATKPTFGVGPLTSKGVAKPGPLHPEKKKKVKEGIFTKADLINEITNSWEVDWYDDTNKEAWADKNGDGWIWNEEPAYHKEGKIVDPLAKIKSSWDDDNLDISKEWDEYQNTKLKKEDLFKMVQNRIDEVKKGVTIDLEHGDEILTGRFKNRKEKVKSIGKNDTNQPTVNKKPMLKFKIPKLNPKEETIEETTTFNSVFGTGFPVVPAFAAKKGEWRTAKKPIWKGGKIVQQVENSGVLNPVNEVNTVKYNPQGKVKIKKKCTKFPYCSQGSIDNPLNISDKVTEPGTYVEQLMKNVHEVAIDTGKSFQEVYQIVKENLNK